MSQATPITTQNRFIFQNSNTTSDNQSSHFPPTPPAHHDNAPSTPTPLNPTSNDYIPTILPHTPTKPLTQSSIVPQPPISTTKIPSTISPNTTITVPTSTVQAHISSIPHQTTPPQTTTNIHPSTPTCYHQHIPSPTNVNSSIPPSDSTTAVTNIHLPVPPTITTTIDQAHINTTTAPYSHSTTHATYHNITSDTTSQTIPTEFQTIYQRITNKSHTHPNIVSPINATQTNPTYIQLHTSSTTNIHLSTSTTPATSSTIHTPVSHQPLLNTA